MSQHTRELGAHCTDTLNRVGRQVHTLRLDGKRHTPAYRQADRNYRRVARLWVALVAQSNPGTV